MRSWPCRLPDRSTSRKSLVCHNSIAQRCQPRKLRIVQHDRGWDMCDRHKALCHHRLYRSSNQLHSQSRCTCAWLIASRKNNSVLGPCWYTADMDLRDRADCRDEGTSLGTCVLVHSCFRRNEVEDQVSTLDRTLFRTSRCMKRAIHLWRDCNQDIAIAWELDSLHWCAEEPRRPLHSGTIS